MASKSALGSNPLKPQTEDDVLRGMLRGGAPRPAAPVVSAVDDDDADDRRASTTVTPGGLLRKTIYFEPDEWQAIRTRCYQDDIKYTQVVRAAVRQYLGLD